MDVEKALLSLITLHESNKAKVKYPLPPLALLYAQYLLDHRGTEFGHRYSYQEFVDIIRKQKGPEDL